MKLPSLLILFFFTTSMAMASCYENCQKLHKDDGFAGCIRACYPEIISFCEGRFPKADKASAAYKFALSQCIKLSYPCQDKCQSKDKSQEASCRNECLGN